MNIVTLGLSAILGKSGEPTKADFTQTGYTKFGLTYEDTAKMAQEDGESAEFWNALNDFSAAKLLPTFGLIPTRKHR